MTETIHFLDVREKFLEWRARHVIPADFSDAAVRQLECFIRFLNRWGYAVVRRDSGTLPTAEIPGIDYDKHPPRPLVKNHNT